MAELTGRVPAREQQAPSAAQQVLAIAWLRWRILANGFRRKGGAAEIIGRIVVLPLFAGLAILPTISAGFLAWYFAHLDQFGHLAWVLWGAFALTQLLNLNVGQPGTTFDPVELIRFPMPVARYALIRLCFGLLSPANILVSLISVAVVVGLTLAQPHLFVMASTAMLVFALTNILFTRMIFAWVDRWLSTRRAREVFTGFIILVSIGVQYLNLNYNPGFQRNRQRHHVTNLQPLRTALHRAHPYLAVLPPELTSAAIASAGKGQAGGWLLDTAACACFGAAFFAVFASRMRTEFRGENLSDAAAPSTVPKRAPPAPLAHAPSPAVAIPTPVSPARQGSSLLPATLGPLLHKELLLLRRNTGLFYGLLAPVVMVFLFASRMSARGGGSHWALLLAVGYALLGVSPITYNSFGSEGTGAQLYFFAPVPLREVFFAKNVFTLLLALFEVATVVVIIGYIAGPPSIAECLFILLWASGTLLFNTAVGNLRSIAAPKKVNSGFSRRAQSAVSAYLGAGIVLASTGLGLGCQWLGGFLERRWIPLLCAVVFAGSAVVVYARGLRGIATYALDHRDSLLQELGKKT